MAESMGIKDEDVTSINDGWRHDFSTTAIAGIFSETTTMTATRQRPLIDAMLSHEGAPPAYTDEKAPTTSQQANIPTNNISLPTDSTPNPLHGHTLNFHHTSFPWRNVNITTTSTGRPAYHAAISEATPNKPDITLHSTSAHGPIIGRSYFRLSRSMRLGIGADELSCEWYDLTSSGFGYDFAFAGRALRLQRTHSEEDGVPGGVVQRANPMHFKVLDVQEGRTVAVYVSEAFHPARMKGSLSFAATVEGALERALEVLVVMGVVGWREKMRRRAAYSGGAGSAGGG